MRLLRRLANRTAHAIRRLALQLPDRPYPSDHPWAVRHSHSR